MAGMIEIRDNTEGGHVAVDFAQILPVLEPEGRGLAWALQAFEVNPLKGFVPDPARPTFADIEERVEQSRCGAILDWQAVCQLAQSNCQTIWATLVGCCEVALIPDRGTTDLCSACEVVVEAIDGECWEVYAKDDEILARFKAAFPNAREVPERA